MIFMMGANSGTHPAEARTQKKTIRVVARKRQS